MIKLNTKTMIRNVIILFALMTSMISHANVQLNGVFSSHMVLQRNKPINIWGKALVNETVTVKFADYKLSTIADKSGNWKVTLAAMSEGGPYELTVEANDTIKLEDILIGDVYICSGQSNMEYRIREFSYALDEANNATNSNIRCLTIPRALSLIKNEDFASKNWMIATGDSILKISAVAYFFARELSNMHNIPIGIIVSAWGGTNVEAWTSPEGLSAMPYIKKIHDDLRSKNEPLLSIETSGYIDPLKTYYKLGKGIREEWYKNTDNWSEIDVPFNADTTKFKDFYGWSWFAKTIEIPMPFRGKNMKLNLGTFEGHCMVFVNGQFVTELKSKYKSVFINASYFNNYKNEIVFRLFNSSSLIKINESPFNYTFYPSGDSKGHVLLSGIWKYKIDSALSSPLKIEEIPNGMAVANRTPSSLYNAMINPITLLSINGFIWYQGESNAQRASEYNTLFPNMIQDWRKQFNQGDLPFFYVQLANYTAAIDTITPSEWAELREAQNKALSLKNVGMACAIDIGEANDIHPKNKQEVGRRLALAAHSIIYNQKLVYSGPVISGFIKTENKIRITFNHYGTGLMAKDRYGYLKAFIIAGDNQKFVFAKAQIINDSTIEVYSDAVLNPVAVRYAWANNPADANLFNKEGLPASPFRTDNWQGITVNKKFVK